MNYLVKFNIYGSHRSGYIANFKSHVTPRLYSSSSTCSLPLKSLSSTLKSTKVSGHLLLRELSDTFVAESKIKLKFDNWDVSKSVKTISVKALILSLIFIDRRALSDYKKFNSQPNVSVKLYGHFFLPNFFVGFLIRGTDDRF